METIAIAQDAFIYGYPIVGPLQHSLQIRRRPRVARIRGAAQPGKFANTRAASPRRRNSAIVAPNCDTPYSYAWLDLRARPTAGEVI